MNSVNIKASKINANERRSALRVEAMAKKVNKKFFKADYEKRYSADDSRPDGTESELVIADDKTVQQEFDESAYNLRNLIKNEVDRAEFLGNFNMDEIKLMNSIWPHIQEQIRQNIKSRIDPAILVKYIQSLLKKYGIYENQATTTNSFFNDSSSSNSSSSNSSLTSSAQFSYDDAFENISVLSDPNEYSDLRHRDNLSLVTTSSKGSASQVQPTVASRSPVSRISRSSSLNATKSSSKASSSKASSIASSTKPSSKTSSTNATKSSSKASSNASSKSSSKSSSKASPKFQLVARPRQSTTKQVMEKLVRGDKAHKEEQLLRLEYKGDSSDKSSSKADSSDKSKASSKASSKADSSDKSKASSKSDSTPEGIAKGLPKRSTMKELQESIQREQEMRERERNQPDFPNFTNEAQFTRGRDATQQRLLISRFHKFLFGTDEIIREDFQQKIKNQKGRFEVYRDLKRVQGYMNERR